MMDQSPMLPSSSGEHSSPYIFDPQFVPPPSSDLMPMPVPYEDFHFASTSSFTPAFPHPPPHRFGLTGPAPLLDASESANIFGFLDNLDESNNFDFTFDFPFPTSAPPYPGMAMETTWTTAPLVEGMNGGMMNISMPDYSVHEHGVGRTLDQTAIRNLSTNGTIYSSPPPHHDPSHSQLLFTPPPHTPHTTHTQLFDPTAPPHRTGIHHSISAPAVSIPTSSTTRPGLTSDPPATKRRKTSPSFDPVHLSPPTSASAASTSTLTSAAAASSSAAMAASKIGLLSESQRRSNHILSEQKRRNAIKIGFQELVDILNLMEEQSGISIKVLEGGGDEGKGMKRGRGRKAEVGGGASKSLILEKAVDLVKWTEEGNRALRDEVERLRTVLENEGVQ
ncbi:hypothetical protein BT69DRAFT_1255521 [Atractiella rhizophila]|nr:hypothetical protein BT69DRAFT_1255521 [Atractiella rhizophila]